MKLTIDDMKMILNDAYPKPKLDRLKEFNRKMINIFSCSSQKSLKSNLKDDLKMIFNYGIMYNFLEFNLKKNNNIEKYL